MQSPPAPYSVRSAQQEEAGDIAALFAASDRSVGSPPTLLTSDLLDDWRRDGVDLRRDTWLVESPEREIVAYGGIWTEGPSLVSSGAVHPAHRGRGLGTFLIDRIEEGAAQHPSWTGPRISLMNIIIPKDASAQLLLLERGYVQERTFQHMVVNLADAPEHEPSDAVEIRLFDPNHDREDMHSLMEHAFENHWDYSPTTFETWWRDMTGGTTYDPSLWWWAIVDGRRVGALLGCVRNSEGWVMDLGVLEDARGRGLGTVLLRHAFAEFKRRGFTTVGLNVDSENETGATHVYERAGMQVRAVFTFYKKELVRAPGYETKRPPFPDLQTVHNVGPPVPIGEGIGEPKSTDDRRAGQ